MFYMVLSLFFVSGFLPALSDMIYIQNFQLSKCDSIDDPIKLQDIDLSFNDEKKLKVSGTMITDVNLTSPITAHVVLKKHIGFWIPVPCEHNMGSCYFDDLCKFGFPPTEECPSELNENHVPCRCPIPVGTYTIPNISSFFNDYKSVYDGKYKGTVTVTTGNTRLACFSVSFKISDVSKNIFTIFRIG